jgi:hypothetical protein
LNLATSAPQSLAQTLSAPAVTPPGLLADPTGGNVRTQLASFLTPGVYDPRTFDEAQITPNFGPDRVQSWSFGVQRELVKNLALEIRYVGNHADNLFQAINENPYIAGLAAAYPSLIPSGVTPCATPAIPEALGRVHCNQGLVYQYTNTAYSNYDGVQSELRATNLFNQLTLTTGYTRSKTLDNTSEVFSTFNAGNSTWAAQNPLNYKGAEYGISGIDFPNNWTVGFNEQIPAFRSQHGVVGHILGGWAISGTYAISSGQPYTPSQFELNYFTGGVANDTAFDLAFIGTFETSRPFSGSPSAPGSQVGIFAGDACSFFGADCTATPSTLLSLNALNATGAVTPATKSQVRYIVNGGTADSVFGTPFGNVGRNVARDYITNSGNFTLYKNIKFWERAALQWNMTMTDVFNHPNFSGVDPFLEDAGLLAEGHGFGVPYLFSGGSRQIYFGLKISF